MEVVFDPASFKDPSGRVFSSEGQIYRTVNLADKAHVKTLLLSRFFNQLVTENKIVATQWEGDFLKHQKIKVISYSSEWSFEMLRQAALLTLEIQERAFAEGFSLKDATSSNIAFEGSKPIFIDVLSFEPYILGMPWLPFGQFYRSFLFPLLITAYTRMPFQPLLEAHNGEIPLSVARCLFSWSHFLRPILLREIWLHSAFEEFAARQPAPPNRSQPVDMKAMIRRLKTTLLAIPTPRLKSDWANYEHSNTYQPGDKDAKKTFVEESIRQFGQGGVCLDLGANTGVYSEVVAPYFSLTVATDRDPLVIDQIFKHRASDKILPLVLDMTNSSPARGWRNKERPAFFERVKPDFFLALALIHHLRITGNIPLEEILDFLRHLAPAGVVEWIGKEDPMVKRLLALKADVYSDYTRENFLSLLHRQFHIKKSERLSNNREIFFVT